MKRYNKYLLQCSIVYVICMLCVVILLSVHLSVLSFLLCILMSIPCKLLFNFFANKNFNSILSKEFDSEKYYDAIHHHRFGLSVLYHLNAEWYVGNYDKLIALSSAGLKSTKNINSKCVFLVYLARAYFDLRDYEKLARTVDSFSKLHTDNRKMEKLFSRYPIFQYYKSYLGKDFEQCIHITESRFKKINKNSLNGKLIWLTNQMNSAIAYYELGNFDKSKEIFKYFIDTTPKLNNFTNQAKNYLEAIEKEDNTVLRTIVCKVDDIEYEQNLHFFKKKSKRIKILLWTTIILVIGAFFGLGYIEYVENQRQQEYYTALEEYEKDLNYALSDHYNHAKFIKYFEMKHGKQNIDTICIVDSSNGLDLVSIVTYDKGETLDIIILAEDIDIDKYYCIKSAVSEFYIGFQVYDIQKNDDGYVVEFNYNDVKYWLGVDYIGETPKTK